jgi:hypothetical protein
VEPFRDLQERQSVEAFPGALDVGVKETRFSMRHRVLRTARLILQRRTRRLRACGPLVSGALTTGLSRGKAFRSGSRGSEPSSPLPKTSQKC